jgi:orotidine-5'-phosphate decarboxylase
MCIKLSEVTPLKSLVLKNPIFIALDIDDFDVAKVIALRCAKKVGGFKVGPRLLLRYGPRVISELAELAPVFVDNKYYDIPSTMTSALRATFEAGASFATIHAQAGSEALTEISQLEKELSAKRFFQVLAVTVLTSYSDKTIPSNWKPLKMADHVESLADLTIRCGLTGIVCSPEEAMALRKRHPASYLVTPGIRLESDSKNDQIRTMNPKEALENGASALVIGRPIVAAADPVAALENILQSLN